MTWACLLTLASSASPCCDCPDGCNCGAPCLCVHASHADRLPAKNAIDRYEDEAVAKKRDLVIWVGTRYKGIESCMDGVCWGEVPAIQQREGDGVVTARYQAGEMVDWRWSALSHNISVIRSMLGRQPWGPRDNPIYATAPSYVPSIFYPASPMCGMGACGMGACGMGACGMGACGMGGCASCGSGGFGRRGR